MLWLLSYSNEKPPLLRGSVSGGSRSHRALTGILLLAAFTSTGCTSQNEPETTAAQSAESTAAAAETTVSDTSASAAESTEVSTVAVAGNTNYGGMSDTSIKVEQIELTEEWDKVFPLSDEVTHRKVTFVNHFGITLAADLYEPKEYTGTLPAIAVAFDPSFTGESGGYPRAFNSPDINVEDYQAAIDFLSVQENVDPERIGIIGICGWGGMALQTASLDTRVKASASMTMYDMSRNTALGYFDSIDEDGRYEARVAYNNQRTADYQNGSYTMGGGLPEEAPEGAPQHFIDYIAYYKTDRGYHARSGNSNNGWAATAGGSLMNMRLFEYAPEIRSAVLLVHGDNAHSLMYSQDAYELLQGENKELMIIPGASHTDLYDQMDIIPFDKLESFFTAAFQ